MVLPVRSVIPGVEISSRTFDYPAECPCCGSEPDDEITIPLSPSRRTLSIDSAHRQLFPYCTRCAAHVAAIGRARAITASLLLLGTTLATVIGFSDSPVAGLLVMTATVVLVLIVGTVLVARVKRRCLPACASIDRAVTFHGWNGSTSAFRFASLAYTVRFAEHNVAKLVDDPQLERLLAAHPRVREEVPTPASPLRAIAPRSRAAWSLHFASQPGVLSRRRALTSALAVTFDADERAALISIVAHAEIDALMADIDGLSPAARQRRAQRAIDSVASDNLPDELREVILRELRLIMLASTRHSLQQQN